MKRVFALFGGIAIVALILLAACAAPANPAAPAASAPTQPPAATGIPGSAAPTVPAASAPTQLPGATAIPTPLRRQKVTLPEDNKPECEGFLPYSVNGNAAVYWIFSMNFRVWRDATHPVGCLLVYAADDHGEIATTGRVSVDTCEANRTIPTVMVTTTSTPLSIIPNGPVSVALATFDGQSYIRCSFNLRGLLPQAKTEFDTLNIGKPIAQKKILQQRAVDALTTPGEFEEYGYFAMGGFGKNLGEGPHPILYYQPKLGACDAAKPVIKNRLNQSDPSKASAIDNTLCNPIAFSVNVNASTAKLKAMLNGDWAEEGCTFAPLPTQQWSAGLDFLQWQNNFGYYQYDYDNPPLQGQPRACDAAQVVGYKAITRRTNTASDPKALVWTGDTDIFIGTTPDLLNGPMLTGQLFQVIFDPNGDSVPPI